MRRPGRGDTRLEIVFVPVVHGLAAIYRARTVDDDGSDEITSLRCRREAVLEVCSKRYRGLNFETLGFVDRALQAVAQPKCYGKVGANFPGVLDIFFVSLSRKIPDAW